MSSCFGKQPIDGTQFVQSKRKSLLEAVTNVACGIFVAWAMTYLVFPWFGFNVTLSTSLWISLIFTAVSLARSYILRRLFNRWDLRLEKQSTQPSIGVHPDILARKKLLDERAGKNSFD